MGVFLRPQTTLLCVILVLTTIQTSVCDVYTDNERGPDHWCLVRVEKEVPNLSVFNGTQPFIQRMSRTCDSYPTQRQRILCRSQPTYRVSYRPVFITSYQMVHTEEWTCCPGFYGRDCMEVCLTCTSLQLMEVKLNNLDQRMYTLYESMNSLASMTTVAPPPLPPALPSTLLPTPVPYTKGEAGETGPPGPIGPRGETGAAGSTGPPGQPGLQGSPGSQGPPGIVGARGQTGLRGQQGSKGQRGDEGPQGDPGTAGQSGVAGPPGQVGEPGTPGTNGDHGMPGPPGQTGEQGESGPVGVNELEEATLDAILMEISELTERMIRIEMLIDQFGGIPIYNQPDINNLGEDIFNNPRGQIDDYESGPVDGYSGPRRSDTPMA